MSIGRFRLAQGSLSARSSLQQRAGRHFPITHSGRGRAASKLGVFEQISRHKRASRFSRVNPWTTLEDTNEYLTGMSWLPPSSPNQPTVHVPAAPNGR